MTLMTFAHRDFAFGLLVLSSSYESLYLNFLKMLFLVTKSPGLVAWSQRQRQSDNHIAFFLFQDSPISYVNKSFISVTTLVLLALIGVYHAVEVQVIFLD